MSQDAAIEAFNRMIADPDFAEAVAADADALAEYPLSEEEREALTADAEVLAPDVMGFQGGFTVTPNQVTFKLADLIGPESFRQRIAFAEGRPRA